MSGMARRAQRLCLCLCSGVLLSGCLSSAASASKVTEQDLAVMKAVLESEECQRTGEKPHVVSDAPAPLARRRFPDDWDPTGGLTAAAVKRSEQNLHWPAMDVCAGRAIVSHAAVEATFDTDRKPPGWEKFEKTFPNTAGVMQVSLPVFSKDDKRAFVYLDWKCGVLCGAGFYLELQETNAGWRVITKKNAWIS